MSASCFNSFRLLVAFKFERRFTIKSLRVTSKDSVIGYEITSSGKKNSTVRKGRYGGGGGHSKPTPTKFFDRLDSFIHERPRLAAEWPQTKQRPAAKFTLDLGGGFVLEVPKARDHLVELYQVKGRAFVPRDNFDLRGSVKAMLADAGTALYFVTAARVWILPLEALLVELDLRGMQPLDLRVRGCRAIHAADAGLGSLAAVFVAEATAAWFVKVVNFDRRLAPRPKTFSLTKVVRDHLGASAHDVRWHAAAVKLADGCLVVGLQNVVESRVVDQHPADDDLMMFAALSSTTVMEEHLCKEVWFNNAEALNQRDWGKIMGGLFGAYAANFKAAFESRRIGRGKLNDIFDDFIEWVKQETIRIATLEADLDRIKKAHGSDNIGEEGYFLNAELANRTENRQDHTVQEWHNRFKADFTVELPAAEDHLLAGLYRLEAGEQLEVDCVLMGDNDKLNKAESQGITRDVLAGRRDGCFSNSAVDEAKRLKRLVIAGRYDSLSRSCFAVILSENSKGSAVVGCSLMGTNILKIEHRNKDDVFHHHLVMQIRGVRRQYSWVFYSLRVNAEGPVEVVDCRKVLMPSVVAGQRYSCSLDTSDVSDHLNSSTFSSAQGSCLFDMIYDGKQPETIDGRIEFFNEKMLEYRNGNKEEVTINFGPNGSVRYYSTNVVFTSEQLRLIPVNYEGYYYHFRNRLCHNLFFNCQHLFNLMTSKETKASNPTIAFTRANGVTVIAASMSRGSHRLGFLTMTGVRRGKFFDFERRLRQADVDKLRSLTMTRLRFQIDLEAGNSEEMFEIIRKEIPVSSEISYDEKTRQATIEVPEVEGFVRHWIEAAADSKVRVRVIRPVATFKFMIDGQRIRASNYDADVDFEHLTFEFGFDD